MSKIRLCNLVDLPDPGSLRANIPGLADNRGVCVVRKDGLVRVYENRCPHTGAPLDWQPGRFLNMTEDLIQCSLHAAQFRIEDGHCIWGPCAGDRLRKLPAFVEGGSVWLHSSDLLADK